MEKNNEVIQTHPLVGWDISTVDSYDALMLRLHYQTPNKSEQEGTEVGQTLWSVSYTHLTLPTKA